jgi:hypothetical protein
MSRPLDFPTRLNLARRMIARGAPSPAVHLADQLAAAGAEVRTIHDRMGAVLPILEPERNWRQRVDASPSDDVRAYLVAAILGCEAWCCHLKRGGPQPAIVRLPLHRADCSRCSQTLRRPPRDEDDRCDVCGQFGVLIFHPFAVRLGPLLVAGDGCPACADALGIRQEVSA